MLENFTRLSTGSAIMIRLFFNFLIFLNNKRHNNTFQLFLCLEGREVEQLLEITSNDCRQRSTSNGQAIRIASSNPPTDECGADELMLVNSCCAEQEAAHSRLILDVNSIAIKAWFLGLFRKFKNQLDPLIFDSILSMITRKC